MLLDLTVLPGSCSFLLLPTDEHGYPSQEPPGGLFPFAAPRSPWPFRLTWGRWEAESAPQPPAPRPSCSPSSRSTFSTARCGRRTGHAGLVRGARPAASPASSRQRPTQDKRTRATLTRLTRARARTPPSWPQASPRRATRSAGMRITGSPAPARAQPHWSPRVKGGAEV